MKYLSGLCLIAAMSLLASPTFACPDGQINVGGIACVPNPAHGPPLPPVPPGLPNPAGSILDPHEQAVQVAGTALEQWLQQSRNSAIGTSQPIPPDIRQQLTGYIADDIMNIVHYKVGDSGFFNLPGIGVRYGDARAMTAIDVIVFDNADDARDPALWAHELTHVKQYKEWTVHSFAIQYARDYNQVENPAYAVQNGFRPWQEAHQSPGVFPAPPPPSDPATFPAPPPAPAMGAFCSTSTVRAGPGPLMPVGSPCRADGPQGPMFGQITQ